jgi:hypothetical protein
MKSEEWFRNRAKELYYDEGQLEVDDNAPVSIGDDDGAYVQAWVWVYREEDDIESPQQRCDEKPVAITKPRRRIT